jgi:3-hydroxymyristoyl/3-hydroxydecanoyl-(acyl carrier protein) dehydratase
VTPTVGRRGSSFLALKYGPARVSGRVRPARARVLCAGHFPGEPLVPGAQLVALMVELGTTLLGAGARLRAVDRAVFRRRVAPHRTITVAARREGSRVEATVACDGERAAAATLRYDAYR